VSCATRRSKPLRRTNTKGRRPRPLVKEAAVSARSAFCGRALLRSPVSAIENDSRARPEIAWTPRVLARLPSRGTPGQLRSLSRRRWWCVTGQGSRWRPSPQPTPHRANPVGLPRSPRYPAPLVARFGLGRQEEPTWPGTKPSTSEPTPAHAERCRRLIACAASRWQARSLELHREEKRQVPGPGVSSNVRGEPSAHRLSPGCCQPVDELLASAVPDVLLPLTRRRSSPALEGTSIRVYRPLGRSS
jgi:hypothetical protein